MSRNLHLNHLDEEHFIFGTVGATEQLSTLQSLIEGNGVIVTEKWDGAPALFVGTDPSDGKFFIGTKSVFNKSPKLYKAVAEIFENEPEGKAKKLAEALVFLKQLNIPKDVVLQGDLIWSNRSDQQYRTYEGKRYVTVHPNTLIYAWETNTPEALQVERAKVGIVFHTTYRGGNTLDTYQASFGANTSVLKESSDVWVRDAKYGRPVMSEEHYDKINGILDEAEKASNTFRSDYISKLMQLIPEAFSGARIQSFYNSQIRQGLYPYDAGAYFKHVQDYYAKQMEKVKTDIAKEKRNTQCKQLLYMMRNNEKAFHNAFYYTSKINEAKLEVIHELNSRNKQVVFVEENGQLCKSESEGYVVIDQVTGSACKLVDRLNFSKMNFSESVSKGWMK